MFQTLLSAGIRFLSHSPAFRVYGKQRREKVWRVIDIVATHRRDYDRRWPLWRAQCITWTDRVIAVGWDFAESILREQISEPASREHPVEVAGGRLSIILRSAAGVTDFPSDSEIVAHECGHTGQARRLCIIHWPVGGALTLLRDRPVCK